MAHVARSEAGYHVSERDKARAVIVLPEGKISFYDKNTQFEAICNAHGCKLKRTAKASEVHGREGQGRPVGLAAAWLALASAPAIQTKADHCCPFFVMGITREQRRAGRDRVKAQPGSEDLLRFERSKTEEEDSEPDELPLSRLPV